MESRGSLPPGSGPQCQADEREKFRHADIAAKLSWVTAGMGALLFCPLFFAFFTSKNLGPQYGHNDGSSFIGWSALAMAFIILGIEEVPLKMRAALTQGPSEINAYTSLSSGMIHCLFFFVLLSLGMQFRWQWMGAIAALNLMMVQQLARSAVIHLGIAAVALWQGVGMVVAFAWGTLVFGDQPNHFWLAVVGVGLLVVAIVLLTLSWMSDAKKEKPTADTAELGERTPLTPEQDSRGWSSTLKGIGFASVTGVFNGTMAAFYMSSEGSEWSPAVMFSYFCSFGVTIFACGASLLAVVVIGGWAKFPTKASTPIPGMLSGLMWAMGHCCVILGSHFLGMSLCNPLVDTNCILPALLGMLVFAELNSPRARLWFAAGLVFAVGGAALLLIYGQPKQSLSHVATFTRLPGSVHS